MFTTRNIDLVGRIRSVLPIFPNCFTAFKPKKASHIYFRAICMVVSCCLAAASFGQTFTMGKKCREQNTQGINYLREKNYEQALATFNMMANSCKTKDGKIASNAGKAEALNGLQRYQDAIAASDAALKASKNKSLMGYFQKSIAQAKLGDPEAASATFSHIFELTEKNQDTKARAANYALMASLQSRQLHNLDSAEYFLAKAEELDPGNTDFVIQRGDMKLDAKDYTGAFEAYDKAVSLGRTDLEMYMIRSDARLKMVQEKYGTTNAQELRKKMTPEEREQVCTELNKALELGLHDMSRDMFSALVCK